MASERQFSTKSNIFALIERGAISGAYRTLKKEYAYDQKYTYRFNLFPIYVRIASNGKGCRSHRDC